MESILLSFGCLKKVLDISGHLLLDWDQLISIVCFLLFEGVLPRSANIKDTLLAKGLAEGCP